MATYQSAVSVSLTAGEDLRGAGPSLVYLVGSGGHAVAMKMPTSNADLIPIGVLGEDPEEATDTTGAGVNVVLFGGVTKAICGATITAGQLLTPSIVVAGAVDGDAVPTAGKVYVGVALTDAVAGDVISVLSNLFLDN